MFAFQSYNGISVEGNIEQPNSRLNRKLLLSNKGPGLQLQTTDLICILVLRTILLTTKQSPRSFFEISTLFFGNIVLYQSVSFLHSVIKHSSQILYSQTSIEGVKQIGIFHFQVWNEVQNVENSTFFLTLNNIQGFPICLCQNF